MAKQHVADELAAAVRNGFVHDVDCTKFAPGRERDCDCHVKLATVALVGLVRAAKNGVRTPIKSPKRTPRRLHHGSEGGK